MQKEFIVNGKVTYPQSSGALTTFTFISQLDGDMFSIKTASADDVAELNYGDTVIVTIAQKSSVQEATPDTTTTTTPDTTTTDTNTTPTE